MLFCPLERLKARTDREWPSAEELFDHLHRELKRKAARTHPLCKPSACLAPADHRKQSLRGEAHEHTLPSTISKGSPRPPRRTARHRFLTDVQRIPQWPQHPAVALKKPARGCDHDGEGQICSALGVPQILELNNRSWSWSGNFWLNYFLPGKKKKKCRSGETESFGINVLVMMKC